MTLCPTFFPPRQQHGADFLPQSRLPEFGQPHPLGRPGHAGWHRLGGQGECGSCDWCHQGSAGWSEGRSCPARGNLGSVDILLCRIHSEPVVSVSK